MTRLLSLILETKPGPYVRLGPRKVNDRVITYPPCPTPHVRTYVLRRDARDLSQSSKAPAPLSASIPYIHTYLVGNSSVGN